MDPGRERAFRLLGELLSDRRSPAPPREEGDDGRGDRFAAELAHGVVRHLARIDWVVQRVSGKPLDNFHPAALAAVRLGVYQLLFTPSVPVYAAVSASVDLVRAHAPQAAGFVNWVLRRVGPEATDLPRREDIADAGVWLATRHSLPPWMVRRWMKRFGEEEAERICAGMNEHPPPHVRVSRRADPVAVAAALAEAGLEATPGRFAPCCLHVRGAGRLTASPPFAQGEIYLQDESSQLAALVLAPRPGERVLDACAGLGGKTTQLADLAGGGARITAVDRDAARLARLEENARRLGLAGIAVLRGDFLDPGTLAGERFDAVLLDAPCSGLGTIPRHPEVKWFKRSADPKRLAALQLRMLGRAADLLAPGGRIVYSTCTTEPEEGEEVVAAFLAAAPGFRVEPPPAGSVLHADELLTPDGFLRTWPHRHGVGAAFVARLVRDGRG